jgi:plastocyanin
MKLFRSLLGTAALVAIAMVVLASGCSKSPTGPGSVGNATLTLSAGSVSPNSVTVAKGGQVTFMNSDTVPHQIASACGELNSGVLQSGMSFTATMASQVEMCSFHDAMNPAVMALQGTITVTSTGGGGY